METHKMLKEIYDCDKIAGRFYGNTLEINLNDILSVLYNWQYGEWKKWEENSQFPQIIFEMCSLYEKKKSDITEQSYECIKYLFNLLELGEETEKVQK